MRELLVWLGIAEAEPRGPSLPARIYLSLGVIAIVIGMGLAFSGEPAIGVFMVLLGVINVGLAIDKRRLDGDRQSVRVDS